MATKAINDADFENEVIKSSNATLVDFWAEWCGPCRALGPKLEEIATEMSDKLTIAKMNIDENPNTPAQFGVRSIPTMIIFKEGKPVEQLVGNQSKEDIVAVLNKHI